MSFTVYRCPECGCTVHAGADSRILCPDCPTLIKCKPEALEYSIDAPPAADPWQFEEPTDGGRSLFKWLRQNYGESSYHVGQKKDGKCWVANSFGTVSTKRIVAWARLKEPQEVPSGR